MREIEGGHERGRRVVDDGGLTRVLLYLLLVKKH